MSLINILHAICFICKDTIELKVEKEIHPMQKPALKKKKDSYTCFHIRVNFKTKCAIRNKEPLHNDSRDHLTVR